METTESGDRTMDSLNEVKDQVRDELRRADTKATTLLSLVGATLAGVIALSGRALPPAAAVLLWVAATPIAAAVVLLLLAIRPRMSGKPIPGTWLHAASASPEQLLQACEDMTREQLAAHAGIIARIARAKFHRITLAVRLLLLGLAVLGLALFLGQVIG